MILTGDQDRAIRTIVAFLRDPAAPTARLTGFAGCGKTTSLGLIARAAEALKMPVAILAPTGKAALRVSEATGRDASTIHRFLYRAMQNHETGDVDFTVAEADQFEGFANGLIIVDEASMVGAEIWTHLRGVSETVGFKILLVGDSFQLEPVERAEEGRTFSFLTVATAYAPHLTEIVRQVADDPIVRASMILRTQNGPSAIYEALRLLPKLEGEPAEIRAREPGTPVICFKNATRHAINARVREILGRKNEYPEAGEPLLVLKNNYGLGVYNGEIVTVAGYRVPPEKAGVVGVTDRKTNTSRFLTYDVPQIDREGGKPASVLLCREEVGGGTFGKIGEYWIGKGAKNAWRAINPRAADVEDDEPRPPYLSANWGFAATCHKMQGSEADHVVVAFEDGVLSGDVSSRRWAYTAVTRGRKSVRWTVVS